MSIPETLAEGRFVRLVRKDHWEYIQRKNVSGIVGILAVTDEDKIVLVEQYRPPLDRPCIEIPAGLAGDVSGAEHEDLAQAARRELFEETGYQAQSMEYLTQGAASAGLSDEVIALYRARGLKKTGHGGGDATESIIVHEVPLSEAPQWLGAMARAGRVIDLKVYAALWFARMT